MEDKSNEVFISMRLSEMYVQDFSQFALSKPVDSEKPLLINFNTGYKFQVFVETNHVQCNLKVKINVIELEEEFATITVVNKFEILELKNLIDQNQNDRLNLPDDLMLNLLSISIGGVRGIISERLRGTALDGQVYPLSDPKELMKSLKESSIQN